MDEAVGGSMSEKEKDKPLAGEPVGTAEAGMVAVGRAASRQPTEAEIQAGILRSMREVVARPYNPNALLPVDNVKVANAPQVVTAGSGRGWQEEKPLAAPPGQDAIERLVNAALPHGSASPLRRKLGGGAGKAGDEQKS